MRGYDESKLIDTETIRDNAEIYAERLYLDIKKIQKRNKKFFSHPNSKYTFQKINGLFYSYEITEIKSLDYLKTEMLALVCMHSMQNLS